MLKYDRALASGKLVSTETLSKAYVPVTLNNGKPNAGNYGLGWTIERGENVGEPNTTVYHTGGAIGLNCVIYRNVTSGQTVIAYDLARPFAYLAATSAFKILNGQNVTIPKKDLATIYARLLVTKGSNAAAETIDRLKSDTANYQLDKDQLIKIGYEFLGDVDPYHLTENPNFDKAIYVFKLCIRLFPDYWNSYDSYADALTRTGNNDLAIKMYRRSIELNPENKGGKEALEKLLHR